MIKYIIVLLAVIFYQNAGLISQEYPSILKDFINCCFTDSEPAYVLFGSKPVCHFKVVNDSRMGSPTDEFEAKLRLGAAWWLRSQPIHENDDYIFKILEQSDGYEFLVLNKSRVREVIGENLHLFQYILGPKVTSEALFKKLSTTSEPFYDVLQHSNALVGILLGFGTTNAILSSRHEALDERSLKFSRFPYVLSCEFQDPKKEWNTFVCFRLFGVRSQPIFDEYPKPSFDFPSVGAEMQYLNNLMSVSSLKLCKYAPKLIFGNYQNTSENQRRIENYENEQRVIKALIHDENILDQVIQRLGIRFLKKESSLHISEPSLRDFAMQLRQQLKYKQFEDMDAAIFGIEDADLESPDRYPKADLHDFYNLKTLSQLQPKVEFTEKHFSSLSIDAQYRCINQDIYIKILQEGSGATLNENSAEGVFSFSVDLPDVPAPIPYAASSHVSLNLNHVISGLALGVQGMQEGELREIQLHPRVAYGLFTNFLPWQPLKVLIQLEKIHPHTSSLTIRPKPLLLERSLHLTSEEKQNLVEMEKALSYHEAKEFWSFCKFSETRSSTGEKFSDRFKTLLAESGSDAIQDPLSLDFHILKILKQRKDKENQRAHHVFQELESSSALIKDQLYLRLDSKGKDRALWPRKISLTLKDLDGKVIKKIESDRLTQDEFSLWDKGLQVGLLERNIGDKGKLFIHPKLADTTHFRNRHGYKTVVAEFEISFPTEGG